MGIGGTTYERALSRSSMDLLKTWMVWVLCLVVVAAVLVMLDRAIRPQDPMSNVVLGAGIAAVVVASVLVRPLRGSPYFVRNLDITGYLDTFLVCAVVSWLGVRLLLSASGNPQVGGGGLHISHMLWGGALMLAALVVGFAYLGRRARWFVAVFAGTGFGLFIDELGKFITSNNDYFYRPATPLLYVLFVTLYLLFRRLGRKGPATGRESMINAFERLRDAAIRDFDRKSVEAVREHLEQANRSGVNVNALSAVLDSIPTWESPPNRFEAALCSIQNRLLVVARTTWFPRVVAVILLVVILNSVASDVEGTLSLLGMGTTVHGAVPSLSRATGLQISTVAGLLSDVLAIAGAFAPLRSRLLAYQLWKAALLNYLLFGAVFDFYYRQYGLSGAVVADVLFILILNTLIRYERQLHRERSSADPVSGSS